MSTRKIAVSTFWQLLSQITMAGLSILTVKFVAIALTKELAGTYNSAYGYLQLFGILADFGLYAVSIREVSRTENKERVLGALLTLRLIILSLSLTSALLIVWILPQWRGTAFPLSVSVAALVPFFVLLTGVLRTVFQVEYQMHFVFIAEVLHRVLTTSLIGIAIVMGVRGSANVQIELLFLIAGGAGALLLFAISLFFAKRITPIHALWDTTLLLSLFRMAAPFGVAYLCVSIFRQFDVAMIALLRPDFELQNAYYGFVARMMDMGFVIPTFLLNSTLPILSERDARGEDTSMLLGKTIVILVILGIISSFFACLWARPLTLLMTTPAYLSTLTSPGSDTALVILAIPLLVNGFILFAFYTLLNRGDWRRLVPILALGAILSLGLNLLLIPPFGFVGSSIGSAITHALLALLLFPIALSRHKIRLPQGSVLRVLLFIILLGGTLFLLRPLLVTDLKTAIALCVMAVLLLLFGWVTGLLKLLDDRETMIGHKERAVL
ncbi:MAG: oligosaccharide flippase family protein [Candidatus Peregrinibacteria bacterium]